MTWVFQKSGPINQYNPKIHVGTQPTRVVHPMLLAMFQNTHPEFYKDLNEQIKTGKLNNQLDLQLGEVPIKESHFLRTPRVNNVSRKIEIHETFLSYLWACTHSVFVRYSETVDYPRINAQVGFIKYKIDKTHIDSAAELFSYARHIIVDFYPWDKTTLPNPEIYLAEKRDYIEQTNIYYTEAVKFILCHEFTHLKLHVDQIDTGTPDSHYLLFEEEADNNAIEMMKKGIGMFGGIFNDGHRLGIECGIILGILSMFFFSAKTEGTRHPSSEDRLTNALEKLNLEEEHPAWGIACVGLQMWDEQFGLNLTWNNSLSYKKEYFSIVQQIKAR
jgi:hypothetical protein